MSRLLNSEQSPLTATTARTSAHLDRCWPSVRVESAEITPGTGCRSVRAVLQLGGLTPADVRVRLAPASAPDGRDTPRLDEARRMFSSLALGNGCFVFETTLPHCDTAEARDWSIHVHPSEPHEGVGVTHRFSG